MEKRGRRANKMPHQCVRCGTLYDDAANEILKGCSCGCRLFFFVKKDALKQIREATANLTSNEKKEIEKDVLNIIGEDLEKETPVILDFESIRVLKPGKFELDLVHLFKKEPLVYKLGEGKYVIDILSTFQQEREKKEK